jgi:transglutaminase-like putative cysteine protease
MSIDRRRLLKTSVAASIVSAALPLTANAQNGLRPRPAAWRHFEIVTRVELAASHGEAQAWIPVPTVNEPEWFRSLGSGWTSNGNATLAEDRNYGSAMLYVEWRRPEKSPVVEVRSRVATRDRAIDFTKPSRPIPLSAREREINTQGTELVPVSGIVKQISDDIVARAKANTDIEKARAIYEWVVDNTFRDAKVRGCGVGDIAAMLKTGNLGGKCADINALFVGLIRASGIPARDLYGIRVAPSKFGYKSLGANSDLITNAQHCRSDVYLADFGWVPVDAADERKFVLEEPPTNLAEDDPRVIAVRDKLFGSSEGNWLAYNSGHDIELPGSIGPRIGFFMYPEAEITGSRLDCLDPDRFKYTIKAIELPAA